MKDKITINPNNVSSEVYHVFTNPKLGTKVHLVKVSLHDIGVYINSITVQPSYKNPDTLWVQMPRFHVRVSWVWPVQMEKTSKLRQLIEQQALDAVANLPEGREFGTPPDFGDKPFKPDTKKFM